MTNNAEEESKLFAMHLDEKTPLYSLRKWQGSQLQNFIYKQSTEQAEKKKNIFKEYFENNKGCTSLNYLLKRMDHSTEDEEYLEPEPANAVPKRSKQHFLKKGSGLLRYTSEGRMKDVSTVDKSTVSQEPDPANAVPKRTKQPFLKKCSGLLRYTPEGRMKGVSTVDKFTVSQRRAYSQSKPPIKLKPATSKNKFPSRQVNHVQFSEPTNFVSYKDFKDKTCSQDDISSTEDKEHRDLLMLENCAQNSSFNSDSSIIQRLINGGLGQEDKENGDFLMLDNCAQNSSFNSDSSSIQRLINGGLGQINPVKESNVKRNLKDFENVETSNEDAPITFANTSFDKILKEVPTRQQLIEDMVSNINPRITSSRRNICDRNADPDWDMNDVGWNRSSTPILNQNNHAHMSAIPEIDTNPNSSLDFPIFVPPNETSIVVESSNSEIADALKKNDNHVYTANFEEEECTHDLPKVECSYSNIPIRNHNLRKHLLDIDNEINMYRSYNAQMAKAIKEAELQKAKIEKDIEDFENYKDDTIKKMENERQILKRQKETFNRLQELQMDNPTVIRRKEMSTLCHKVIKVKGELESERLKLTSEKEKLKNQIVISERKRDSLKLENRKIHENYRELLDILKGKKPETKNAKVQTYAVEERSSKDTSKASDDDAKKTQLENVKQNQIHKDKSDIRSDKPRVRFNLIPEFDFLSLTEKIAGRVVDDFIQPEVNDPVQNEHVNLDYTPEMRKKTLEKDLGYKGNKVGDKLERIYPSGARPKILPNGIKKCISADGETKKILFSNGDVEEILPNDTTIYRYANGIVETHFPSGEEISEYPNGQIQKLLPNGAKEIYHPDGSIQIIHPNGVKEMVDKDGTKTMVYPDGMEEIHFPNGKITICTSEFTQTIYPDGSVKSVFASGRKEIRYPDGTIRVQCKGSEPVREPGNILKKN